MKLVFKTHIGGDKNDPYREEAEGGSLLIAVISLEQKLTHFFGEDAHWSFLKLEEMLPKLRAYGYYKSFDFSTPEDAFLIFDPERHAESDFDL